MSSALAATLAAAATLSLSLMGSRDPGVGTAPWPGCDDGKLFIQKDLPLDAAWACPAPSWPESTQSYRSTDTVYYPEPAKQVCMGTPISYNLTIPNSGPYRPVGAESGEYLYCPAERWLNNLHHGATVLLYHPCAPLSERVRLSALARSCLSHYVITPHPELSRTGVALVSWGRTLELSTILSPAACDWLEAVATAAETGTHPEDVAAVRKYSFLLVRRAERHARHATPARADAMRSVRLCCERSLFAPLGRGEEARRRGRGGRGRRRGRQRRDAETPEKTESATDPSPPASSQTLQPSKESAPRPGPPRPRPEQPQPASAGRPDPAILGSVLVRKTVTDPGAATGPAGQGKAADAAGQTDRGSAGQNSAERKTPTDAGDGDGDGGGARGGQNPPERRPTHAAAAAAAGGNTQPPPAVPPSRPDVPGGRGRTPRTDEAVWAAGALGFLLVLLALSVLHTRLYRQWRTTPSMYWHDPRRDYDSVADVLRKRLRIADRRHRRKSYQPRRQECVLLPSSDEEDHHDDGGDEDQ